MSLTQDSAVVEPSPRDIPAGKVLLAEYGEVNDSNRSRFEILERRAAKGREYLLYRKSPGFESAGSCARWTNGGFGVRFESAGAWQGRQTRTLESARELFDSWTATDL